jgi:hypothetical protein
MRSFIAMLCGKDETKYRQCQFVWNHYRYVCTVWLACVFATALEMRDVLNAQELTGEDGRQQAISLATAHIAMLDSWRRGDLFIEESTHFDSSGPGQPGMLGESDAQHRLIFDRDSGRFYYARRRVTRHAKIDTQGGFDPHDQVDQFAIIIDSPNKVTSLRNRNDAPKQDRDFKTIEHTLDKYVVPIVWGLGIMPFGEPAAVTAADHDLRIQSAFQGSFKKLDNAIDRYSLTVKHARGDYTETVDLDTALNVARSRKMVSYFEINGKRGIFRQYDEQFEWEKLNSGDIVPRRVVRAEIKPAPHLGGSALYTVTTIHNFNWRAFNTSIADHVFDRKHIEDLSYINRSIELESQQNQLLNK